MKLLLIRGTYYRVKKDQSAREIARAFGCPVRALIFLNGLTEEVCEGQILKLPPSGNLYRVRGGESKSLLCGSCEKFLEKNGTQWLFPTQEVYL